MLKESVIKFMVEGLCGGSYSKALVLLLWGTLPTVAILFNAGACPANGGGVVLPSKGCSAI